MAVRYYFKSCKQSRMDVIVLNFILGYFSTPAPCAYYKEKVWPQGEVKAPMYSMGSRTRYRKRKESLWWIYFLK